MAVGSREPSAGEEVINKHLYYALFPQTQESLADVSGTDINTTKKPQYLFKVHVFPPIEMCLEFPLFRYFPVNVSKVPPA